MVDTFTAILQQATNILDARLIGVIGPSAGSAVRTRIGQVERRNHVFLRCQVSDHMVTAEVVAIRSNEMVRCEVEFFGYPTGGEESALCGKCVMYLTYAMKYAPLRVEQRIISPC